MAVLVESIRYGTKLVAVTCGSCNIPFGLPDALCTARLRDGGSFYCPNGHRISWSETENERLKRERDAAWSATGRVREELAAERRQHAATKGKLTKTIRRAEAGVCPHCTRTFTNVQRHIATKHAAGGEVMGMVR